MVVMLVVKPENLAGTMVLTFDGILQTLADLVKRLEVVLNKALLMIK